MIQLEAVSFRYPDGSWALRGVDLAVEAGSSLGISGANGSGKSTLLRLLNGLLRPTTGRVLVGGRDAASSRVSDLSRLVGLAFQEPDDQLFQATVVREVAAGSPSLLVAEQALELVGLSERRTEHPHDLGYSRRKLVTIAAVVAMQTPVVVLDEPTTGQDAAGRRALAGLVRHLRDNGRTLIVAGHDLEFMFAHLERNITLSRRPTGPNSWTSIDSGGN